jgi:hypothetical protein
MALPQIGRPLERLIDEIKQMVTAANDAGSGPNN